MRGLIIIAGVAAVASLVLVVGASGSGKRAAGSETIRVHAAISSFQQVDNPPAGESAGDLLVFIEDLAERGRQIGRTTGSCVLVEPPTRYQCTSTASLPEGTLTIVGRPDLDKKVARGAITGGTGRYRRARGTVRVERLSDETERITYTILD